MLYSFLQPQVSPHQIILIAGPALRIDDPDASLFSLPVQPQTPFGIEADLVNVVHLPAPVFLCGQLQSTPCRHAASPFFIHSFTILPHT